MESKKQQQLPAHDNSDLMSRLGNFLPQLKSANQELMLLTTNTNSSPTTGVGGSNANTNQMQLDAGLKLDEDSDSDDDDSENDEHLHSKSNPLIQEVETDGVPQNKNDGRCETSAANKTTNTNANANTNDNASSKAAAPTIQLQFSLGDMSGNPLMKLLAGDDDDDDSSNANSVDEDDDVDPEQAARLQSVANFLKTPTGESSAIKHTHAHTNVLVTTSGETTKGKKRPLITELS